ncbi:SKP1-like protein 1A [Solanum stenotomum]|uniref:SKP1-like protein 1A n=1 Tax=Solanum stenotomum TaxID=172797 RepID=UPI0020D05B74|nr:SKP1-like protein 1A [Solanum stenotomum]
MSSEKLITLKTSDGEEFQLYESIVMRSQVIKNIVQDVDCASNVIPLTNVGRKTMCKVVEYWKKHSEEGVSKGVLVDFDMNFMKVDQSVLFYLLLTADSLNDKEMLDVMCQEVADRIKGKTPEEIRKEFEFVIKNDFTPKEEEEIRKENAWAFE